MNNLIVQSAPHIHDKATTSSLMTMVLMALLPAAAASVWIFGPRALLLIAVCMSASLGLEWLSCRLLGRKSPLYDRSALVSGLLLALNLPVTLPLWMAVVGCFIAIVVVKQLFGGIGHNIVNPAIAARIVLLISFPQQMTTWALPIKQQQVDAITGATPLGLLAGEGSGEIPSYLQLFLGQHGGSLGETCAAALLLGGVFLLITRVIDPVIPFTYLGGTFVLCIILGQDPMFHLLSGGLLLGALFMATDYSTTPIVPRARAIFGLGCAVLTMVIRCFGSYPEGVSYAILLMNLASPLISQLCTVRPLGAKPVKATEKEA